MKSIKPGRGPSGMGFIGSLVAIVFGIFWMAGAASITNGAEEMGFPGISLFPLFGLLFIGVGIANAIYHFKNATGKERFSVYDIVDQKEEGDPAEGWVRDNSPASGAHDGKYCTECGLALNREDNYCSRCGKKAQ